MLLSSPLRPKLSEPPETTTDLKPSLELSLLEETMTTTVADAMSAHAKRPQEDPLDITPPKLLEKLSRRPPRTSREKLRKERTKRKPKLESRRLRRKPREQRPNKKPLMRPRRSNMPSRKPSTNKKKSMPRKSKIKLSRKLESKPKKKSPRSVMMPIKPSKLRLLVMPLIKPLTRSQKEPKNQRKTPPPPRLILIRPPLTPKPLVIKSPIPLKPPETKPKPPLKLLKVKPMVLVRKPKEPPLNSEPHQQSEYEMKCEMKNTLDYSIWKSNFRNFVN